MARTGPSVLSICSGIGGLELGVRRVWPGAHVVGYVEREAYAATVLLARMEAEELEPAPVWCGNLEDLDAGLFEGVDLVTAGFPCQPFSVAGKRKGIKDDRWIWPAIADLLGRVRPGWVLLENVPGLVRHGLEHVLRDLAALGFGAEWGCFRASEAGAPHRRDRWFCLAHSGQRGAWRVQHESGTGRFTTDAKNGGQDVGNSDRSIHEGRGPAESSGLPFAWPPGPDDAGAWAEVGVEAQPAVRRVADGVPNRVDRLRCLGNAVVPQQAELAIRTLYGRMT